MGFGLMLLKRIWNYPPPWQNGFFLFMGFDVNQMVLQPG
jgi:hypothetical protein